MHFDQHVHAPVKRSLFQFGSLRIRHRGHDDQNAIRTKSPRLGNLIGIIHEIFAQCWQLGRRSR